jgi:His-Xaa-Ser system protein HxsD
MDDFITLRLDGRVYSLDAIKRAAYDMSHLAAFNIYHDKATQVTLKIKVCSHAPSDILETLLNKVLDHQIRIDMDRQFGPLREIIAAQAFSPTDQLPDIFSGFTGSNDV